MKKLFFIFFTLLASSFTVFAQENCNDGIDNDGDGLIDCADPDCLFPPTEEQGCNCIDGIDNDGDGKIDAFDPKCASFYGLTFIGDDTDCAITPPAMGDVFATIGSTTVESGQNTVDTQSKMAIGDVDGDGIPDVVATSKWGRQIRLIATTDGQDDGSDAGDIKADYKTKESNRYFDLEVLIADIDRDGTAEIFATIYERQKSSPKAITDYFIGRWDYDGSTTLSETWRVNLGSKRPGIPGIADFDGDGRGEIYLKNHIYDAHTGALLASAGGDWNTEVNAAPVAVNVTGDARLELISGKNIYSVGGSPVSSLTLIQDMNTLGLAQYFPKVLDDVFEYGITNFSSTSVADFDDDGNVDVFISGAVGSTAGPTAIFYWNVAKGTVNTFLPTHPDTGIPPSVVTYPNGWPWGTGRVNLGELDGDGILEANFISGNQLYALEEGPGGTLVDMWGGPKTLNDSRSGVVATTVYDFDNDGAFELVYRDAQVLSIIDGATGSTTYWSTSCQSHTMTEGPIIADMNGDGATDICVPCFTGPGLFKIDGDLSKQALGEIRVFFSSDNSWLPTRKVYNQPGYFVVNINDDLTLPFPQLGQAMVFGNDPCSNGLPGPQQPFNTYLNQVPTLGVNGCPVYPGPDIAFVGNDPALQPGDPGYVDPSDPSYFPSVEVIPPICGDLAIVVNFNIINDGLRAITTDIPTSFWDGDPSVDLTATLLHTELLPVTNFAIGDTLSYSGVTFNSTGMAFTLYVVLNDDGTLIPPFPIGGIIEECRIGNNMVAFPITPDPFTVQLEIIQDNIKCDNAAPDNGELRAIVLEGGLEAPDLSKYDFQWYAGADTTAAVVPDPLGSLDRLTGMAEGNYTVVVTNLNKGCASLPIDTTLVRIGVDPDINIIENSPQSQCLPFNGELEVQIVGGNAGYTFEWFKGAGFTPWGGGAVISLLEKDDYVVRVTKDGCTKTAAHSLSGPVFPDGVANTVSHVIDCADANSGVIDADASVSGVIQDPAGFDFTWYHWDDSTSTLGLEILSSFGTGKTRTGLPVGWYAVIVKNLGTNCESFLPVPTLVSDLTQIPTVTLSELQPNSSCDPLNPNGQLQVTIDLGGIPQDPALYTIEWFEGLSTSPVNQIFTTAGINGEVVTGVGILTTPYTVSVSSALNCATTDTLSVSQNVFVPVISAVAINNSICNPALASGNPFNGSASSSVTFNGVPVTPAELTANYSFIWYAGSDIITDPIIPGETNPALLNLDAGFYSVTVSLDSVSCTSLPITVEIQNLTSLPIIIISESPETTCAGTPNGSLIAAVDVGGVPTIAGYTIEWYVGNGTGGPPVAVTSGAEGENALELVGNQNYTARIINDATGCEDQLTFYLNDNSVTPVGSAAMIPNSVCDPALTNPAIQFNGAVTATIELNTIPVVDYSPYEFTWYAGGSVVNPIIPGELTRQLANVQDGFYTFTAFDLNLSCSSIPVTIEVTKVIVIPVATIVEDAAQTSCDKDFPNGQLTASALSGGVPSADGYSYQWYHGKVTGSHLFDGRHLFEEPKDGNIIGANGETITNLKAKDFTVLITDNSSGCQQSVIFKVSELITKPVVTILAADIISNSICDASLTNPPAVATGSIDASSVTFNGLPVNIAEYRYDWYDGSAVKPTADFSAQGDAGGNIYSNLVDGFYTVEVTRNVPGVGFMCVSDPITVEITSNAVLPAVSIIEDAAQTSCDNNNPNGQLTASALTSGVPSPGGYTYLWFEGSRTGNHLHHADDRHLFVEGIDGNIIGANGETITNLKAKDFTVLITDNATGCQESMIFKVSELIIDPVITILPADLTANTICNPGLTNPAVLADGSVDASTVTYNGAPVPLADYRFDWYDGNVVKPTADFSAQGDAGGNIYPNLSAGFYTVEVTRTTPGLGFMCTSLPITVEVTNNLTFPVITGIDTPSTNCIPDTDPNGQIVADTWVDINGNGLRDVGVEDLPGLFTYQWHSGIDTSIPIVGETNLTLSNVQGGAGRNYTFEAVHLASGCSQTYTVLLNDASQVPIISLTPADNTVCDIAITGGLYNGSVTAVFNDVNGAALGHNIATDYTITWTDVLTNPVVDGNPATPLVLDSVQGGDYTLVLSNDILGCSSLPVTITVDDVPAPLAILFTSLNNTSCDVIANGDILAAIDLDNDGVIDPGENVMANLADYTFVWHMGNTTTGVIVPAGNTPEPNHINLLDGNEFYTLAVTRLSTGCINTLTEWLPKVVTIADITVTITDYADCTTNVNLEVSINNLADFSPFDDPATDFIYTWYQGTNAATGTELLTPGVVFTPTGAILTNLDGATELPIGDYTVVVEHSNSKCIAPEESGQVMAPPLLFDINPTMFEAATTCDNGSGKIWVDVTDNASAYNAIGPFVYEWFVGAPTNTVPVRYYSWDASILPAGGYLEQVNVPTNSFYTIPMVAFDAPAGEAFPAEDIGGNGADASLSGVISGIYTVKVTTENGNGCSEYITIEVPFQGSQQNNVVTVFHDTSCTSDNGAIEVNLEPDGLVLTLPSQYNIYLFEGTNPTLTTGVDPVVGTFLDVQPGIDPLGTGNLFGPTSGLTLVPGQAYTIASIPILGGLGRCWSVPSTVTVEEWANDPTINLAGTINPNTSCALPGTPDGSLLLTIDHHINEDWYGTVADPEPTYEILAVPADGTYPNITIGAGFALSTGNHLVPNLGPTDYTITVTSSRGCFTTKTFFIPDEPFVTEVTSFVVTNTTSCSPLNGSIEVSGINQIGNPAALSRSDFMFTWYYDINGNGVFDDLSFYAEAGEEVNGNPDKGEVYDINNAGFAGPGIYWVEISGLPAAGVGLDCPSAPIQFEILDQAVDPTFIYNVTANTACDPASADGSFFIDPDRNSPAAGAPAFTTWTIDITSVPALSTLPIGPNVMPGVADVFTATGLIHGQYDFTVIDDATGCSITTGSLNIPENQLPPVLDNIGFTVVDQFICSDDGSITITQIETVISGTPGPPVTAPTTNTDLNMANYTFKWYLNSVAPINEIVGITDNVLDIADAGFAGAGIYWVEITKVAANPGEGGVGCTSAPYQFEILDQSVDPIFTYDVTVNTACDILSPDGSFFIDPDRNSPAAGAPAFTSWTIDITSVPVGSTLPIGPNALALEAGVFTASGLLHGQYDFTVIDDATGCSITTGSLNIPENQLPPVLDNIGFTVVDQFICNPDGSIIITQIETVVSGTPGPPVTAPITTVDANMANYTFTWYVDSVAFSTMVGDNNNILDITDAGFKGAATYFVEVTKIAANPGEGGIGCTSIPYLFDIRDLSVDPLYSVNTSSSTACGPAGADGSVTITPNTNGSVVPLTTWSYTFTGPSPIPPTTNGLASTQFTNLLPGDYTFTLTYDNTTCSTTGIFNIPDNPVAPLLLSPDPIVVHQATCNVGGSITVSSVTTIESITLNSVPDVNLSNYEFIWYVGEEYDSAIQVYTDIGLSGSAGHIYNITDPGFAGAGTYWLEINKINTNPGDGGLGCLSIPYKIVIEDQSINPLVAFSQTSNTACNLTLANGRITAAAATAGVSVPAITSVFIWYNGPSSASPLFNDGVDGTIDRSVAGEETLLDVAPGIYTVNITDGNTGCTVEASFEVDDQPSIPDLNLDTAVTVDQTVCLPSGSITVVGTDIIVGGVPLNAGDEFGFIFTWRLGSPTAAPIDSANAGVSTGLPIQGPRLDSTNYLSMGAGTYYVTIASKIGIGAGCTGPPVSKVINDLSVQPDIFFITTANSSCDIALPNGSIAAIAQEADGTTDTYTFAWSYTGTGVMPPQVDLGTTSTIPNAPDGNYSVIVTNTLTGCSFAQGRTLILDLSLSIPNNLVVIKTDPLDCNPSGRIEVISVDIAGVPAAIANFEFEWYAGSINPANLILDGALNPITTPNLENQLPGKYFVTARNLSTKCESLDMEIDILADDIILPAVVIVENQPQSSCDVATPNGILSATVDGGNDDTNPNYVFTWYSGPAVNIVNLIANGNASILQNAVAGEYTVDVQNLISGCSMTSTFFVSDVTELLRLQVSVSVIPVTLCTIDNGVLEARITNHPDLGNFQFDWTGPNGFTATGALINNVSPGTYTVTAIDITGTFCPALLADGIIADERITPPITIIEDNPLTNCDITRLNGQLSASVNGRVGGYDFEWYNGPTATGPIMHTANIYSQLDIGTYTVLVRDQLTQCTSTMSADITDGTVTPPSPTATVLNNLNDCVNPDGEITADVNGSTIGYSFNWYDGTSVSPPADETSADYTNLDLGDYTVTTTDLQTGCVSAPVTVPITDERVYAEFKYNTLLANCETSNGAIELVFLDAYEIQEVAWFDAATGVEVDRAANLYNYPAGDYEVTVTTFFGCETDGQASIGTDITNYNGVSANGDGQNDVFVIDCITLFPSNIVKIFNRSGLLVYEGKGYNNTDVVFDGIGENGFYLLGENLPDGTYFYIVDKGDGSRPVTGFLELMR